MKRSISNLYLISAPEVDMFKIGISRNPLARFQALQGANAVQLLLIKTWAVDQKMALTAERYAHAALRDSRIRGEWFKVEQGWAIDVIEMAIIFISRRFKQRTELKPFYVRWWALPPLPAEDE